MKCGKYSSHSVDAAGNSQELGGSGWDKNRKRFKQVIDKSTQESNDCGQMRKHYLGESRTLVS